MPSPKDLFAMVETGTAINILIVLVTVVWVAFKLYPTLKKLLDAYAERQEQQAAISKDIDELKAGFQELTKHMETLSNRTSQDYQQLNQQLKDIWKVTQAQQDYIQDSLAERELLIDCTLNITKGLQELGVNGPTKQAEEDIKKYLTHKSHDARVVHGVAQTVIKSYDS